MWLKPLSAGVSPRVSSGRTTTAVADAEAVDARADLGDRPRHLVADHLRRPYAVVHAAVGDVEVRAADAAVGDVEPHLAGRGRHGGGVARARSAPSPS